MARSFPLIGVWVETPTGVRRQVSTANISGALGAMVSAALVAVKHGAMSASVREFELDGPEKVLGIYDWRHLEETA